MHDGGRSRARLTPSRGLASAAEALQRAVVDGAAQPVGRHGPGRSPAAERRGATSLPGAGAATPKLRTGAFDALPGAEIVLDPGRRLLLASARARRVFGLGPGDLGRPITDLRLSGCPPELQEHLDQVMDDQRPLEVKQVPWRHGTQARMFDIRIAPLPVGYGLLGTHITYTDITERRLLERRLADVRNELAGVHRELSAKAQQLELNLEQQRTVLEQLGRASAEMVSATEQLERLDDERRSPERARARLDDGLDSASASSSTPRR